MDDYLVSTPDAPIYASDYIDYGPAIGGGSPGVLDYLKFGGSTATGLLSAINQSRAATAPAAAKPTNVGLLLGIGAAVLVVLVLVVSLGRK